MPRIDLVFDDNDTLLYRTVDGERVIELSDIDISEVCLSASAEIFDNYIKHLSSRSFYDTYVPHVDDVEKSIENLLIALGKAVVNDWIIDKLQETLDDNQDSE